MNMKGIKIPKKLVVAILIGIAVYPFIYFILNLLYVEHSQKFIDINISANTIETVSLAARNKGQKFHEYSLLELKEVDKGNFKATFILNEEVGLGQLKLILGNSPNELILTSLVFRSKNKSLTLDKEDLYLFLKAKESTTIQLHEKEVKLTSDSGPIHVRSIDSSRDIFNQINTRRKLFLALIIVSILSALYIFSKLNFRIQENTKKLVLVSVFICILFTPLFIKYQSITKTEKRILAKKPIFTWHNILSYHREYGTYFSDNYGFRSNLIKVHNHSKYHLFKTSPIPDLVIIGKDKWLFNPRESAIDIYQNKQKYTVKELEIIRTNLEAKRDWLASKNIKFYVLIPPLKTRVYPELLPEQYKKIHPESKVEQLISYLKSTSDINIIYPLVALQKAEEDIPTYYSNDMHWSYYGALVGFNSLLSQISNDFPTITPKPISEYKLVESSAYGDLGLMLGIKEFYEITETKPVINNSSGSKLITSVSAGKGDPDFLFPSMLTTNADTSLPSVILFRDSFSNYFLPYASENFSSCLFLWTHNFKPEIIEKEEPDIVVHEIYERFLDQLLNAPF